MNISFETYTLHNLMDRVGQKELWESDSACVKRKQREK